MLAKVLRFVRLPLLMVLIFAIGRFALGAAGVPYGTRSNSVFSVVVITLVSCIYWGALSKRAGFGWGGTALVGASIGLWAQILVLLLTVISVAAGVTGSYYVNPETIPRPEGHENDPVTMGLVLGQRLIGLVVNTIIAVVEAFIGRLLGGLAPKPED
jgi:uncharacterized membrane protein